MCRCPRRPDLPPMLSRKPSARATVRVMIVEDQALVRAAIRQALTSPGVDVVGEAASAESAVEVALARRPDVLLLDIDLPGMTGVHLVRELAPRLPDTRIVMLTVSATDQDLLEAFRYGASGYLTKDLTPEALLRAVTGAHAGDLAVPRRMAARLVRRLVETARYAPTTSDDKELATLSAREEQVLASLVGGLTDRQIAEALTISTRTVETHVSSILRKLAVRNRADAATRYRARRGA